MPHLTGPLNLDVNKVLLGRKLISFRGPTIKRCIKLWRTISSFCIFGPTAVIIIVVVVVVVDVAAVVVVVIAVVCLICVLIFIK